MFKKALMLSAYNWKVMLKALICQLLILALMSALCFVMFGGLVEDCLAIFSDINFGEFLSETIKSVVNAEFDVNEFSAQLSTVIDQTREAIESIPNMWNRVEVSYIACFFMFLVYRMLVSVSDLTVGCQIQEFMTSNATRPFLWYFVKKFGASMKFVCLQMLLALPLDFFIILVGIGICVSLTVFMGWWSVVPAIAVLLVLYSARHTYFAFWLPTVTTEDLGVAKSLTKSVSRIPYRFWNVFWKTLVLICIMGVCITVSLLFVENSVLKFVLCTVPNLVLFFIMKCVNFTEYFAANNHPFFCKKVYVEGTVGFNKKAARKARAEAKNAR